MPDDVLHHITGFLWSEPSEEWHEFRDPSVLRCRNHPERRNDALALSSCCKSLRRSVFQDLLVTNVMIDLSYEDLLQLESMSADLRRHVR
jgi:hypothetical protein